MERLDNWESEGSQLCMMGCNENGKDACVEDCSEETKKLHQKLV